MFIGLIGIGGINAPLYIYVSRWFDRRRGSALALTRAEPTRRGAVAAGVPAAIAGFGWRQTMLWYAVAEIVIIVPLAAIYFRHPPEVIHPAAATAPLGSSARTRLAAQCGIREMCAAAVLCCIPMAMPQGHLVAFCSDLGISRSMGALMLSVLLGTAFLAGKSGV